MLSGLGENNMLIGGLRDEIFVIDTALNARTDVGTITDFTIKDASV